MLLRFFLLLVSASFTASCAFYPLVNSGEEKQDSITSLVLLGSFSPNPSFSVLSVFPEKDAVDVNLNSTIQWEFSNILNASSASSDYFKVVAGTEIVNGKLIVKKNFVVFLPDTFLSSDLNHNVDVYTGLTDSKGITLANDFQSSFRTITLVDTTPPTVTSVSPQNLSTNNSLNEVIFVNFSEAILSTSVDNSSLTITSGGVPITGTVTMIGQSSLAFTPTSNWTPFQTIQVVVNNTVLDLASNSLANNYNFEFSILDTGNVSVYAGSTSGISGNAAGSSTNARFDNPSYLTIDGFGNIFVTDTNNCSIKQINTSGTVSFYAGSNSGLCGYVNANGLAGRFNFPQGIVMNPANTQLFVTDKFTHTVRRIVTTTPFAVTTNNGNNASANTNGSGTTSRLSFPEGITVDPAGALYVSDTGNCAIRKIVGTTATTLAGTAPSSVGICGYVNATGTSARFSSPRGVAVDSTGNVYVADTGNCAIRKITSTGVVTTFAGPSTSGNCGFVDGASSVARFKNPQGIVVDPSGNLFVTDTGNCAIRKITPLGYVTTYAGGQPPTASCGNVSQTKLTSRFNNPKGIVRDANGNLYITDTLNHSIKKIEPN